MARKDAEFALCALHNAPGPSRCEAGATQEVAQGRLTKQLLAPPEAERSSFYL